MTREGELAQGRLVYDRLFAACRREVRGRDATIRLLVVALLADGHVLLEHDPGSGKTTLAKVLGHAISSGPAGAPPAFRRVQFTPDLLPSDITGTTVLDPATGESRFHRGPIFTHVLLADEINRAGAKVQAALLEGMAERQVTIDGCSYVLDRPFFVVATQNPLDQVGTYALSRAQLDRFLFKIEMTPLDRAGELEVLDQHDAAASSVAAGKATVDPAEIEGARRIVRDGVFVSRLVHECLVDIAGALRSDPRIRQGISTRALVDAIPALQTWAMIHGRDFVTQGDVKALLVPLFVHRLEACVGLQSAERAVRDCASHVLERYIRRTLVSA